MYSPVQLNGIVPKKNFRTSSKGVGSAKTKGARVDSFSQSVAEAMETPVLPSSADSQQGIPWEEISDWVGELENHGEALSRIPTLENYYQFRSLLQKILEKAVPRALLIRKDYSLNTANLTQKEYHLVTEVNKELGSLLKMIESNQKNNFAIANRVVSIKGLIVDFYS